MFKKKTPPSKKPLPKTLKPGESVTLSANELQDAANYYNQLNQAMTQQLNAQQQAQWQTNTYGNICYNNVFTNALSTSGATFSISTPVYSTGVAYATCAPGYYANYPFSTPPMQEKTPKAVKVPVEKDPTIYEALDTYLAEKKRQEKAVG